MSLLFFIGSVAGLVVANTVEKLSDRNTTQFMATVKNVEIEGSGDDEYGRIHTEEYGDKLIILNIREIIDMNDYNSLHGGQTVFFRIENIWVDLFKEMSFIHIVSLKTSEKEVVSLNNYNEYLDNQHFLITITSIVLGTFFLLVSVYCILPLKGINIFHKFKKILKRTEDLKSE